MIESVESIKILAAYGRILTASKSEIFKLFTLAIAGYGLFGIILEVTLHVVLDGAYYLPIQFDATKDQALQNYPELDTFFA